MATMRGKNNWMQRKSLCMQTLVVCLLPLAGCDVAQSARGDLSRIVSSDPLKPHPRQTATRTAPPVAKTEPAKTEAATTTPPAATNGSTASSTDTQPDATRDTTDQSSVQLIGKSESEVRALLGPPTTVEERAPGKTWRYRDGKCTLDIQLYPDVQTRQFGTLAYEVKSDDNTDEGNRACMVQLRSRSQSHG
jgi:hypothetical protein